jgi:osmotically-inducible protein OsmY
MRIAVAASLLLSASAALAVTPRSDSEIEVNVEHRLEANAELGGRSIRVSVDRGVATLEGRVHLLAESWKAEKVVADVRGLTGIENHLAVEKTGRSNDEIRAALKRHFEDRLELASGNVRIAVDAGHVVLSGTVKDARVRFTAREAASEIRGVLSVEDRIESPPASDEDILKAVKRLLGPTSLVGVRGDVRPTVKDGIVTLDGMVLLLSSRISAERVVLGINGVKQVENKLTVKVKRPPGE